jgi:uncharacterized damage-inducible protein DinB
MELLDRLLGHDAWTTGELLLRCRELSEEQLDQPFDIDERSVRKLILHMIANVEVWTDLMLGRTVRGRLEGRAAVRDLASRHERAYSEFAALARRLESEGRQDHLWTDHLDTPPTTKTFGGAVAHVITHNMHHRAHLLLMLGRIGLTGLPEGDVLTWEGQARNGENR